MILKKTFKANEMMLLTQLSVLSCPSDFRLFVRDGNSHPSYRLLAAFRAAVNRQSFLLLAPWFLLYHMEGRRKTFRRLFQICIESFR